MLAPRTPFTGPGIVDVGQPCSDGRVSK